MAHLISVLHNGPLNNPNKKLKLMNSKYSVQHLACSLDDILDDSRSTSLRKTFFDWLRCALLSWFSISLISMNSSQSWETFSNDCKYRSFWGEEPQPSQLPPLKVLSDLTPVKRSPTFSIFVIPTRKPCPTVNKSMSAMLQCEVILRWAWY